jgi:hypothetical protein
MLPRSILLAEDEADRLPVSVDRGALVVDEPRGKPDLLHCREVEVRLDLRRLLRPATQSPSAGASVFFKAGKRRSSSARLVVKNTSTSTPGFAPSLVPSGVAE